MTLRRLQTPSTATLHITLIVSLLVYQPVNMTSSLNVGTVLFGSVDALTCCLENEKYFSLVFRRMLNNVVAVPLQNAKGDAYICAFISFVRGSARAAVIKTPPATARAFVAALFDVTGGYLRSYLLPVTREAFYAGNVRFVEVRRLYALYDDIKDYLSTNGQGWRPPIGQYRILHYVRTLDITFSTPESAFACDNFLLNATARTMESQNTTNYSVMPIPYFDDNLNPSSVALPLRYGALRSIVTPESAYILLAHYVRSVRCLRDRGVSTDTFVKYNRNFRRWLLKSVLPRLGDERWYPAFGGILRVLKKTGEYIKTNSPIKRDARTRRQAKHQFEMSEARLASLNMDTLVNAVADDLIPIDVAVLQKLMYPKIKPDSNTGWQISILPEIMNPNKKNDQHTEHFKDTTRIENFEPTVSLTTPFNLHENELNLELEGKMIIQNDTAEFVIIPPDPKQYTNEISTKSDAMTSEPVSKKGESEDVNESGNFEFDSENLNQPLVKEKEFDNHKIVPVHEASSSRTTQTLNSKFTKEYLKTKRQAQTIKWTTSSLKKHLSSPVLLFTENTHLKSSLEENASKTGSIKLNHAFLIEESPSLMSIKKEKLLKDDPSKLTTEDSIKTTKFSSVCSTTETTTTTITETSWNSTSQFAQKLFSIEKLAIKPTTKFKHQMNKEISHELIYQNLPTSSTEELFSEYNSSSSESTHPTEISTVDETSKPKYLPMKHKTSTFENTMINLLKEDASNPALSATTAPPPAAVVDSSIYSALFGVGVGPENFENMTDGCVHRTWDGAHAASPIVAHMLAGVLQSPAFNLDFIVCHVLLCLLIWLVLACASFGQGDCHFMWRVERGDGHGRTVEDTLPRLPIVQRTYYSLSGELPSTSSGRKSIFARCKESLSTVRSVPSSYRRAKESATQDEVTPLTERPTSVYKQHSSSIVERGKPTSGITDNGHHRLSAGGSLSRGLVPTRCPFSKTQQHFVENEVESESDDLSEEEIFSRDPYKFR